MTRVGSRASGAAAAGLLLFGAGAAAAQETAILHGPPSVAAQVLGVERAFAARTASAGAATAFAEYMDPSDSRAFLGGEPVRGARAIAAAHDDGGRLAWVPREVFASKDGEMATAWGTWTYTLPKAAAPAVTGRYVTVWRKDPTGAWKAIVDIGAPDAAKP